jgi:geranylgeranylglycerol-phosphate geranylgeranyltransferase
MLRQILVLIRVRSCLAGAAVSIVGSRIVSGGSLGLEEIAASFSVAFAIAFAQTYNDVVDRFLDEVDKPWRPLPSGRMSLLAARRVGAVAAALSLSTALTVSLGLALFCLVVLLLSWAYSMYWKGTVLLGNLVVAVLASTAVPYGALASGGALSLQLLAVQATVFTVVLAHEVVKTIRDADGDALAGLSTLATRAGVSVAARVAVGLIGISVLVCVTPALNAPRPSLYLAVALAGIVVPSLLAACLLATRVQRAQDVAKPFALLRLAWGGMVLALLML